MITKTSTQIIEYIQIKRQVTPRELVDHFSLSERAIFKQLKKLIEKEELKKIGKPPKVFYLINDEDSAINVTQLQGDIKKIINDHYLIITPIGERKEGVEGFFYWCQKNGLPVKKTAKEYVKTIEKYHSFMKEGLIDGLKKMESTFDKVWLDHIFYLDFYSIERFGKTRLGQLLLYAKQSQSRGFIKILVNNIKPKIDHLIKKHHIDAIGFIPPTVKREVQFMIELKKHLHLKIPTLSIIKVKTDIAVPQKTLNKLPDRIANARSTIIVDEHRFYKNILIIDDAIGSGATLNETSAQIKSKKLAQNIVGFVITGSFKGFDVISEV